MAQSEETKACRLELEQEEGLEADIPLVVDQLVATCMGEACPAHVAPVPLPDMERVAGILESIRRVLFPGYFGRERLERVNLAYALGQEVTRLFASLSDQITWAVRHDCMRYGLDCTNCAQRGRVAAMEFLRELPGLRRILALDVEATLAGDPAAGGPDEVIFCYPGLMATTVYRAAHALWHLGVPIIPRMMTEQAHSRTGIDIHPAAHIGQGFFIDHGTGVVVGETTIIGDNVRIYQGVTLGALSLPRDAGQKLKNTKRHPTIEDDVIIYAGATILGGDTVVGARSVIGGNVWLTESVPADTRVMLKKPELVYMGPAPAARPEDGESGGEA